MDCDPAIPDPAVGAFDETGRSPTAEGMRRCGLPNSVATWPIACVDLDEIAAAASGSGKRYTVTVPGEQRDRIAGGGAGGGYTAVVSRATCRWPDTARSALRFTVHASRRTPALRSYRDCVDQLHTDRRA